MSENLTFIETLITSIINNRNMPKVQVEREISPILDIYMPDILKELVGKNNQRYQHILSEFPLQVVQEKGKINNSSKNIDSLFLEDNDTLIFIELKTDFTSYNKKQKKFYSDIIQNIKNNSANFLFEFLDTLSKKSSKKTKYILARESILNKFNIEKLRAIRKAKLIYIVPKRTKNETLKELDGIDAIIDFTAIGSVRVTKFKDEWSIISKKIIDLDKYEKNKK